MGSKDRRTAVRRRPRPSGTKVPDLTRAQDHHSESGSEAVHATMNSDDGKPPLPPLHQPSENGIPYGAAVQGRRSESDDEAIRLAQRKPVLSLVGDDVWKLITTVLSLPAHLYPVWKWILLVYIVWLIVTHSVAYIHRSAMAALAPICAIPIVGSRLQFCTVSPNTEADASTVAMTQDGLTLVLDQVGVNFDLARDMVDHEFTVRDLRIRVTASELSRRKELTLELDSLIRYTKQTAKDLSRFTAKVGKSIDAVEIFDDYAVHALEGIAESQRNPPRLPSRLISALSPLSAFSLVEAEYTEERVKEVFISTAARISSKVKLLLDDSFNLGHNLDQIQETLDRIKELSVDEVGDLPQMAVLGALWSRLARPDDYAQYESHTSLLDDLAGFYKSSSNVMKETIAALNRVEAELGEFRDDFATPGLILKDEPLEVVVALLRSSGERLQAGKTKLEYIEGGGRPQVEALRSASTRTATLKQA